MAGGEALVEEVKGGRGLGRVGLRREIYHVVLQRCPDSRASVEARVKARDEKRWWCRSCSGEAIQGEQNIRPPCHNLT
jgi:hypothetical protein